MLRHAQPSTAFPPTHSAAHRAAPVQPLSLFVSPPSTTFCPFSALPYLSSLCCFSQNTPFFFFLPSPFHPWLIEMTHVSVSEWWCHWLLWRDCPMRALLYGGSSPAAACRLVVVTKQKHTRTSCQTHICDYEILFWLHHFSGYFLALKDWCNSSILYQGSYGSNEPKTVQHMLMNVKINNVQSNFAVCVSSAGPYTINHILATKSNKILSFIVKITKPLLNTYTNTCKLTKNKLMLHI